MFEKIDLQLVCFGTQSFINHTTIEAFFIIRLFCDIHKLVSVEQQSEYEVDFVIINENVDCGTVSFGDVADEFFIRLCTM